MTRPLPTFFVPHGAPTFALHPGAAGAALATRSRLLPTPRAIVIVSAHWNTTVPTVGFAERPSTLHDFYGFPDALYAIRYPATGCREAARDVVDAIRQSGLPVTEDAGRGLDHGAWVPLRLMFPDAQVPVVPLSLQSHLGPEGAYRLGRALSPLTDRGFLIVGSGSITHNLRDYQAARLHAGRAPTYVRAFADWLADHLAINARAALLDFRRQAPDAARAQPDDDHLLPLFVAWGAGGEAPEATRFHTGIDDFVIAMDAYTFQAATGEPE